jgi:hypothetical protein
MKLIAPCLLLCVLATGQSQSPSVRTNAACSPVAPGNNNTFNLTCSGLSKKQVEQISKLLNAILTNQIDVDKLVANLNPHIHGYLTPDNKPDPPSDLPPMVRDQRHEALISSPNSINVYLGSNLINVTGDQCTIFNIMDKDVLWVDRSKEGLMISGVVFAKDKKIIAKLDRNEIDINPNNTFKRDLQKHRLIVTDDSDTEVLNVAFLNPRAVQITGKFYKEGYGTEGKRDVIIEADTLWIGTNRHLHEVQSGCNTNTIAYKIGIDGDGTDVSRHGGRGPHF